MSYKQGLVLIVDDEDFVVSEFECEFAYAVQMYMGKLDDLGRRYIVKTYGQGIEPYKRKPTKFAFIDRLRDKSASSTSEPSHR